MNWKSGAGFFLDSGTHGLKKRIEPEDRELRRVQAKLGEVMMRPRACGRSDRKKAMRGGVAEARAMEPAAQPVHAPAPNPGNSKLAMVDQLKHRTRSPDKFAEFSRQEPWAEPRTARWPTTSLSRDCLSGHRRDSQRAVY
jgi:hypothetical protein